MDLNNDGYVDVLSGKYNPNDITWFKGSKDGFQDGVIIKEERRQVDERSWATPYLLKRILYKAIPFFADIDGDNDLDMFVTDFNCVYLNRNEGTPEEPKFGRREFMTTVNGDTIVSTHPSVAVIDWDGDKVLDLLVADNNTEESDMGIRFYKGLGDERFAEPKPIFENKNGRKFIPGDKYFIFPTDWNNDGKWDLLVGASVYYQNGKMMDAPNNEICFFDKIKKVKTNVEVRELFTGSKRVGHVYLLLGK